MKAYAWYNEIDSFAVQWLRELIKAGAITDGEVDERDIRDVRPEDLRGFTRCHFFAGIGGWDYALQLAGWPDDRPVWTGSCPCQPFSSAGKGEGFSDPRHLWPSWFRLIEECRPVVIVGEQVESAVRHGWLDLVFDNLEAIDYACWAKPVPAACSGTPNIRQRLWWLADADYAERWEIGLDRLDGRDGADGGWTEAHGLAGARGEVRRLANTDVEGSGGRRVCGPRQGDGASTGATCERSEGLRADGRLADAHDPRSQGRIERWDSADGWSLGTGSVGECGGLPSHLGGRPVDWLRCRDAKWRPVEPGTFPLAHGVPARVGRLRGYGNAIVPQVAAAFVSAYLDGPC